MKIAYGKFGRCWNLDLKKASTVGGDVDVIRLLKRLATARPRDEFILVGKTSPLDPLKHGFPHNVTNPWATSKFTLKPMRYLDVKAHPELITEYLKGWRRCSKDVHVDAAVLWVGQHGATSIPLPRSEIDWGEGELTSPLVSSTNYDAYLFDFLNSRKLEPILIVPDARNYIKFRDLKRPPTGTVLGQYNMERRAAFEQYKSWPSKHIGVRMGSQIITQLRYEYAGVELTALDDPRFIDRSRESLTGRVPFGLIANENRKEVSVPRLPLVRDWLLPTFKRMPIFGNWSDESKTELGIDIKPVPVSQMYETLQKFACTITLPASGSGWATSKPWECFAAGVVCFFHERYDTQNNVLMHKAYGTDHIADREALSTFLRVSTKEELAERVKMVWKDNNLFHDIMYAQRAHFIRAFKLWQGGARRVLERLEEATCK